MTPLTPLCAVPRFPQRFEPQAWAEDGFSSPQASAYWSDRSCGVACVRMMLAFTGRPLPRLSTLLREGLALEGFLSRGWIHARLADLMRSHGSPAQALAADEAALRAELALGRPAIVSVAQQLPQDGQRGGHLIVLAGLSRDDEGQDWVIFRDPSAWGAQHDRVPLSRLLASYGGRAIVLI